MADYPNRSDLRTQAAAAPKGQQYGQAGMQLDSQKVVPIAGRATGKSSPVSQQPPMQGLAPGEIPTLSDPSVRPNEPLTAGLPSGPGPGPSSLTTAAYGPQELSVMRALYQKFPNEDIRRLIEWTEANLG